ncbi:MAG: hypothetical protein QM715_07020 [Nibricoccus sp.]
MRLRPQLRLPLLAVLVTAGIVATDCLLRREKKPHEAERIDPNALCSIAGRTSALGSTRLTSENQTIAPVENPTKSFVAQSELSDEIVVQIRELAEADPAAVADAALREPVSALRERMLLEALPLWADRDPASVGEWLGARPPAREFDLGLSALARHPVFVAKMPDAALSLATEITDPALRIGAQRSVVQNWIQRDPARIREVLQQSRDLSSGDRAMLLSELDGLLASR